MNVRTFLEIGLALTAIFVGFRIGRAVGNQLLGPRVPVA